MTNAVISHAVSAQNVILWQYDQAANFCALVEHIEDLGRGATERFWKYFAESVYGLFAAETADDFGLSLWGVFVGLRRPLLNVGAAQDPMSAELYRKVLHARLKLLMPGGTLPDIVRYCDDIFGEGKVTVTDNHDMSIAYALSDPTALDGDPELKALYGLSGYWQFYPAGVRDNGDPGALFFGFGAQHAAQTGAKITSGFGRCVFHPPARHWAFYDRSMRLLPDQQNYAMATTPPTAPLTQFKSNAVGSPCAHSVSRLQSPVLPPSPRLASNLPPSLTPASWYLVFSNSQYSAPVPWSPTSRWHDLTVTFVGSGDESVFPTDTITAVWESV